MASQHSVVPRTVSRTLTLCQDIMPWLVNTSASPHPAAASASGPQPQPQHQSLATASIPAADHEPCWYSSHPSIAKHGWKVLSGRVPWVRQDSGRGQCSARGTPVAGAGPPLPLSVLLPLCSLLSFCACCCCCCATTVERACLPTLLLPHASQPSLPSTTPPFTPLYSVLA